MKIVKYVLILVLLSSCKSYSTKKFYQMRDSSDFYRDKSYCYAKCNKVDSMRYSAEMCAGVNSSIRQLLNREEWIQRCEEVHNRRYNYSKVVYRGKVKKVIIGCPLHGEFEQYAGNHLNGNGCLTCAKIIMNYYFRIFDKESSEIPCSLYIIKLKGEKEVFYKIGISANISNRFAEIKSLYSINTLLDFKTNLEEAITLEKNILDYYKELKYIPNKKFAGKTECLSIKLDIEEVKKKYGIYT